MNGRTLTVAAALGTAVRTTIKDWFMMTSAGDRSNYKIDFFLAPGHAYGRSGRPPWA